MKNVLLIVAPQGYQPTEFSTTLNTLKNAGHHIEIASKSKENATAMDGSSTTVNLDISEIQIINFDCIIFIGGSGTTSYFHNSTILDIATSAFKLGKVIGAICIAPVILANAGILKNIEATVFPSEVQTLVKQGAIPTEKPVVVSGKIVTADGPQSANVFAQELLKLLA